MNNKDTDKIWKHIEVINDEMGQIQIHVATNATHIQWLRKMQWWQLGLMTTFGIATITLLISLMFGF